MKTVKKGFFKFIVANVAVILTIVLLPAFLVSENVAFYGGIMDYLFGNES
ncbi:hypothetical protein [Oceanobacillus rekensis]|nr:hypothetical protein [Oceanobacillus rekensis]